MMIGLATQSTEVTRGSNAQKHEKTDQSMEATSKSVRCDTS
jgi:hypothetical protein